ncbi:lysophospholipid acyltransferase family protein [Flavobacterium agricola]|uniref:lysophospholipid acyltransferase family protein n=1 Tax=Flavobacterium agricola TaxID=2870839 RepID=UPI0029390697|nr:lipid A biosynthesis acyltransferase [Flavobacterium agricola]
MKYLLYIITYAFLWCISILPFSLLYLLSDFIYILVYRIIGYRKKTVRSNIKLAFPTYTDKQVLQIEKAFYHYMCDMFLEMIKTLTISKQEIENRFQFKNIELVKEYEKKGKSIVLMCSHYASWEWMSVLGLYLDTEAYGIYKKIANPYFDKLVRKIRSKFNAHLIDTKQTAGTIKKNQDKGIHATYLFISDQTPKLNKNNYWHSFLGVETPIHMGAEKLAVELNMNVLYAKVSKVKRVLRSRIFRDY